MDFTHIDRKSKKKWAKLIQYLQVLSAKETRVVHNCTLFSETGLMSAATPEEMLTALQKG